MCDPTIAMTAASTALSLYAQQQNTDVQTEHQNNLMIQRQQEMEANQILANRAASNEQSQINKQVIEKQIETSQTMTENSIEAAKARAAQIVASGESGVSGKSVDHLLADLAAKEARFEDSVRQNQEGFARNAEDRKDTVEAKRQGRIASVQPYIPKPIAGPDWAGAVMKVGGAGIRYWESKQNK